MNDKIAVGEAGKDFQKLARTVLEAPEPAAKKAAAKSKETAEKVCCTAETARVACDLQPVRCSGMLHRLMDVRHCGVIAPATRLQKGHPARLVEHAQEEQRMALSNSFGCLNAAAVPCR